MRPSPNGFACRNPCLGCTLCDQPWCDQKPGCFEGCMKADSGDCEQVPGWWEVDSATQPGIGAYPMDYYAKDGGVWNSSYHKAPRRRGANGQRTSAEPVVSEVLTHGATVGA